MKIFYKISKETQDFFETIGETRAEIFSIEEFIHPEIPILQPIFKKEEVAKMHQFFEETTKEEKSFWEKTMEGLLEHKLELNQVEEEIPKTTRKQKTGKKDKNVKSIKQKKRINQETTTGIHVTPQNWREIIPIQRQKKSIFCIQHI
ncbi:MAG: hypothetical protein ACRCSV_02235 [Chlamydiales bacterium]